MNPEHTQIFKNDLTPEEQKKQDAIFEKEEDTKEKDEKTLGIIDFIVTAIEVIADNT